MVTDIGVRDASYNDFLGKAVRSQLHRVKPKLCFVAGGPYMDVRRLIAFVAEKEKTYIDRLAKQQAYSFKTNPAGFRVRRARI
ncbi:MAG TPA: hypothetical protein VHU84_06075 [Lacipirellulaceae bacterium]|nr:hypothetical protein [Lacipirellulaceae bacterium]